MLSFRVSIRTRGQRNLPFELTVYNYTLKPPKNITQLNTKFDFSVNSLHQILFLFSLSNFHYVNLRL